MQPFRDYLKEQMEGVPVTTWDPSAIRLDDPGDRDTVNDEIHPGIAGHTFNRVSRSELVRLVPIVQPKACTQLQVLWR